MQRANLGVSAIVIVTMAVLGVPALGSAADSKGPDQTQGPGSRSRTDWGPPVVQEDNVDRCKGDGVPACLVSVGSHLNNRTGELVTDFDLGEELGLVHLSLAANPIAVVSVIASTSKMFDPPDSSYMEVEIAGRRERFEIAPVREQRRLAYFFDGFLSNGSRVPTGCYDYVITLGNRYRPDNAVPADKGGRSTDDLGTGPVPGERVHQARYKGTVAISNRIDAPLGAGWTLAGLSRIVTDSEKRAFVEDSDGELLGCSDEKEQESGKPSDSSRVGSEGPPEEKYRLTRNPDNSFVEVRPGGRVRQYDSQGLLVRSGSGGLDWSYRYTQDGRLTEIRHGVGSTARACNLQWKERSVEIKCGDSHLATLAKDDQGNLRSIETAGGSYARYGYIHPWPRDHLIGTLDKKVGHEHLLRRYEYDSYGMLGTIYDTLDPPDARRKPLFSVDPYEKNGLVNGPHSGPASETP